MKAPSQPQQRAPESQARTRNWYRVSSSRLRKVDDVTLAPTVRLRLVVSPCARHSIWNDASPMVRSSHWIRMLVAVTLAGRTFSGGTRTSTTTTKPVGTLDFTVTDRWPTGAVKGFPATTRVRVNLQHVPAELRPAQEPLDPDENTWPSS